MATRMILIHGAFVNPQSFEFFAPFFRARGYDVMAPEWPRKATTGYTADEDLGGLGVAEIVDHYQSLIEALPDPPVIMGHSFGGLFTELLLNRGLGLAGVGLSPAPPKGVLPLSWSELKVAAPALLHPSKRRGVVHLTPEQFNYGFTNTFPPEEAKKAYDRYYVPETGRIFFDAGLAAFQMDSPVDVDYAKPDRAPLLMIAAENDHTVPPSIVHAAYRKYDKTPARTDTIEFPERPHMMMVAPGWEEIAENIAAWLEEALPADKVPQMAGATAEGK